MLSDEKKQEEKDGLQQEKESKRKNFREASFSEIVSFSKLTLVGVGLFLIALIVSVILQVENIQILPDLERFGVGLFGIPLLVLLLGFVLDVLRWRDFTDWGALGAFVAYLGLLLIFLPLILYPFALVDEVVFWFMVISGILITIIGFTSHATDLDDKIEQLFNNFWTTLRNFDFRLFISSLLQLVRGIIAGTIRYLWRGLRNLITRIILFMKMISHSFKLIAKSVLFFFTQTVPATIKRSLIVTWNNFHWLGLGAIISYFLISDFLACFCLNTGLVIIIGFFFALGVIYPQRDRLTRVVHRAQGYAWETGYRINYRLRTLAEGRRKIDCLSCGRTISLESRECKHCEIEVKRCMICKLPIKTGQKPIECPHCKNPAHKEHWKFWVNIKHDCPACKRAVTA
ncbi:MAG: hypothetical protein ACXAEU_12405 [Candidatus Hodarchaeales archaeon]|jgi:hypothetical protein